MNGKLYIFGRHPVLEMLQSEPERIVKIFMKDSLSKAVSEEVALLAKRKNIPIEKTDERSLAEFSQGGNHQGLVALISEAKALDLSSWLISVKDISNPCVVVLDELEDTHNVGAIIRTAAGLGAHGIIFGKHRQAPITGTVYKTSAGTVGKIPLISVSNINDAIRKLKENKFWAYGLDGAAEKTIWQEKFDAPTCFIVGAEGSGMRAETKKLCDVLLKIPMERGVESLNASVSAALAIGEWKRWNIEHRP